MKKLKRNRLKSIVSLICTVLSAWLILSSACIGVSATTTSGSCGEGVSWSYDPNSKTLTISGTGEIDDYSIGNNPPPWKVNSCKIVNVVIEDGITKIGSFAFYGCEDLVSVSIAESVTSLSESIFRDCLKLENINIPKK